MHFVTEKDYINLCVIVTTHAFCIPKFAILLGLVVIILVRWPSEIIVTEWIKSPNFAGGFFSTY